MGKLEAKQWFGNLSTPNAMTRVVTSTPCILVLISTSDLEEIGAPFKPPAVETEEPADSELTLEHLTFLDYKIGQGTFAKVSDSQQLISCTTALLCCSATASPV